MPLTNSWEHTPPKTKEEMADLIEIFAIILKMQSDKNHRNSVKLDTPFHAKYIPSISIENYLKRYVNYLELDEQDLIAMLILLDRYMEKTNYHHPLTLFNMHRLIATAFEIEHKFYNDNALNSLFYAQMAGLSREEMNQLELNLLATLQFDLYIAPKTYLHYKQSIVKFARTQESIHNRVKPYLVSMSLADIQILEELKQSPFYHPPETDIFIEQELIEPQEDTSTPNFIESDGQAQSLKKHVDVPNKNKRGYDPRLLSSSPKKITALHELTSEVENNYPLNP